MLYFSDMNVLSRTIQLSGKEVKLWLNKALKALKLLCITLGVFLIIAIILSFTDLPFWAYYWLGTHNADIGREPNLIVLMGGGGMPSADGLMRCYKAADVATETPAAPLIIAIPRDTARLEESPELLTASELILRGVDSARLLFEPNGSNTYSQVVNIRSMFSENALDTIVIRVVTSPEHMLRTVKVFRKVGFKEVGGQPAFEKDIPEELLSKKQRSSGKAPAGGMALRYNIWNYLKYEITVLREYCAIVYYKLRGWI